MRIPLLIVLMLATCGCAVRKPFHAAYIFAYCNQKRPDGSCQQWARTVPNNECVPSEVNMICQ